MGLKQRLLQGQTTLSAGSFPGDTPINDPQSGFVQDNSPTNTYESETVGQPNNGSALFNTLDNTALDITDPTSTTNVATPTFDWITNYPPLVSGEFNGAPSQYTPIYNANNTYLDSILDINNTPQTNTLGQTGLDNTNSNAVPTTIIPDNTSYPNNYPPLVSGEFNGAPSLYGLTYAAENTYLDNVPIQDPNSPQLSTLEQTGLDNIDTNSEPTTITPNSISSPNNYPELVSGEFGSAPSQYSSPYNSTNTYLDNVSIEDQNSPQLSTLEQTGLDNTNINSEPTSVTPNSISSPNNYPELVSGEFGGAPSPYGPQYNVESTYLNSIDDINNTPQVTSLFFTGLDNTNANAEPTTVVPNNILYPNNYPALTSGEFNGAPSQYVSSYNSNNTYLDSISDINNTPQVDTLEQTGLDNTNSNAISTTIIPDNISYPNNYPELVNGEFNGAPSQYVSSYNSNNTYLNQITLPEFGGIQSSSLLDSGLSIDTSNAVETTFIVPLPDTITTYPSDNVTSIIGGAPQPFNQLWGQSKFYYDYMKENFEAH